MDVQVVQCDGRGHVDPSVRAWAVSVVGTYVFDTAESTVDPSLSDAENAAWMLTKIVANNDLRGRKTVGFMDRVSRVLNAYPSVILRIEDVPVGKKLSKHCLYAKVRQYEPTYLEQLSHLEDWGHEDAFGVGRVEVSGMPGAALESPVCSCVSV